MWRGDAKGISFRTRSGNSLRPDSTWSDWSVPATGADSVLITSPNARYIQWRADFASAGGASPLLDSVTIAYLPPEHAPCHPQHFGSGTRQQNLAKSTTAATAASSNAAYSITVT